MPKGKDDIIRHHNLNKSFSEVINKSILFKTCLLSMRRYHFYQIMIFLAINGVLVAGGGGGGGGAGTKCMEYIRVSTPRMVGPFFTVIELVPRVLTLQIIGQ